MGDVKSVSSDSKINIPPKPPTLRDKLIGGAVIVGGVGVIGATTYSAMNRDWAKFSSTQNFEKGTFMIGIATMGAGGGLLGSHLFLGNSRLFNVGMITWCVGGVVVGFGMLENALKINDRTAMIGGSAVSLSFILGAGYLALKAAQDTSANNVASVLSHVAVANNGLAISGQF